MTLPRQESNFEKDAKGHFINKIIPATNPSVTGNFSVRIHATDGVNVRVELMIVSPTDHSHVLHSFGIVDQVLGKPITLEGLESTINFLPKGVT